MQQRTTTSIDYVTTSTSFSDDIDTNISTSAPDDDVSNVTSNVIASSPYRGGNTTSGDHVTNYASSAWTTEAPGDLSSSMTSAPIQSLPTPADVTRTRHVDSTFTGWITEKQNLSGLHASYNLYILGATFGLMLLCFALVVCWVQCKKRLTLFKYERLPARADQHQQQQQQQGDPDYVYKPSNGADLLDEQYENTFVGVSIPILQEVTRL